MASYGTKRLEELTRRLVLATAQGGIEWQETDGPSSYMCMLAGPSVVISSADNDGSFPYTLQILNDQGAVVESVRSDGSDPWSDDNSELVDLYNAARRKATNVEEVLDTILRQLPPIQNSKGNSFQDEPPF